MLPHSRFRYPRFFRGCFFANFADERGCVRRAEQRAARHQNFRARLHERHGGLRIHAAVHFDHGVRLRLGQHALRLGDLLNARGDQLLSAEAGVYRHDQQQIQIGDYLFQTA